VGAGGGRGSAGRGGVAGAAGPDAGMMLTARTMRHDREPDEVIMKTAANPPQVALPSTVGVPIEPNTAWLPLPPKAEPMSAPLPAWSNTSPMINQAHDDVDGDDENET